jgi:RNA-directed DNA polymerase
MKAFRHAILRLWLQQLPRRSQRSRWTWQRFLEKLGTQLPEIQILHPYPNEHFDARIRGRNRVR